MSVGSDIGGLLANAALTGSTVSIETTFNPGSPLTVDLTPGDPSQSSPNPVGAFLNSLIKPKITFSNGGLEIASVAPAGDPTSGPPWGLLILGAALALAAGVMAAILVK